MNCKYKINQLKNNTTENNNNDTPLILLADNENDIELVSNLLVEKGAKIFEENKQGYTAILNAIGKNNHVLFDIFFDKYTEKKIYDPQKFPLWLNIAIASGNLHVVKKLLPF